jgi:hypothetical protein
VIIDYRDGPAIYIRIASVVQRVKEKKAVAVFTGRFGVIEVEDFNNFN